MTNGGDSLAAGAVTAGYGSDGADVGRVIEDAFSIERDRAIVSPYFVPHVMKERGPLWLESACGELVEIYRGTSHIETARGIVDGVLLVDRMVLNSCVAKGSGPVYLTGAFGSNEHFPQMLADLLGTEMDWWTNLIFPRSAPRACVRRPPKGRGWHPLEVGTCTAPGMGRGQRRPMGRLPDYSARRNH